MSCSSLVFRRPIPDDHTRVVAVLRSWWDGRDPRAQLPRVFFTHFRTTSLLVEHEDRLVGFLVGFFCQDHPGEAVVHLVGVAPEWRRVGLARDLYRRFFALARAAGREVVCCVVAPVDGDSIAFHAALGFSVAGGGEEVDGVPAPTERGPGGESHLLFGLRLDSDEAVSRSPRVYSRLREAGA